MKREEIDEDDARIEVVAKAIAEHGIGRPWDDFEEVNAFDIDQSDIRGYARAAIASLTREQGLADPVAWAYVNYDGECEQIEWGGVPFNDKAFTLLYAAPPPSSLADPVADPLEEGWSADLHCIAAAPPPPATDRADALEEAASEGYAEGYAEGQSDVVGCHADTFRFVVSWLQKRGQLEGGDFESEGISAYDVIDALNEHESETARALNRQTGEAK